MEAKKEAAEERAALLKAQESNAVDRLGCFKDGMSAETSSRPCPPSPLCSRPMKSAVHALWPNVRIAIPL
eukprot:1689171-Pleurochrysis_carterae.AAC.1